MKHLNTFNVLQEIRRIFFLLIDTDKKILWIAIIYGIGISLLTLAVPVSVQLLINSVAHIASQEAIIGLALLLLFLLLCSAFLTLLQSYVLEIFERSIYIRLSSHIALCNLFADYQYSEHANKADLTNRYFDIMTLQKVIPNLIIGLFAFFLQMIVGIIVVSSYHSSLFIFNICFMIILWIIWRLWGASALMASIILSDAKYQTAKHIEQIATTYDYYTSHAHSIYGIKKTNGLIAQYLEYRKKYFKFTFLQQMSFLGLYAFSSAGLLGGGGILVINGELTLGQLVAAELILSSIFYGATRLGYILNDAYHLGAALEEVYRIYQMPIEDNKGKLLPESSAQNLVFDNVIYSDNRGRKTILNFTFKAGHKILISCGNYKIQQYILHAIVRHLDIKSGRILLGHTDIRDMEARVLRDTIVILDKPVIFEATIKEYLTLGNDDITSSDVYSVLELLELHSIVDDLENKIDTQLSSIGMPLSPTQTLRLKFAAALLLKPKVIVINQFYDSLSAAMQQRILQRLRGLENITIIYFSNNHHIDGFDEKLFIATEVK